MPTEEVPRTLELAVGEAWTTPLEGSGGGYRWHADVKGDDGVVEATTDYAEGDVGASGWRTEQATVTGVGPGKVEVHLVQRRSWESATGEGGQIMQVTVRPHEGRSHKERGTDHG